MKIRSLHPLFWLPLLVLFSACSNIKSHPVSWEDIASTIPSTPVYIASVNLDFQADSALNDIWGNEDMIGLLEKGLDLDTVKPSHIVVVGTPDATFITWPLPDPRLVADKVETWPVVSLNNTDDANMLVSGKASLVISSTQAWVVNNPNGDNYVNNLLSAAMNTKAVHVQPFSNCIINCPKAAAAVVHYNDRFYNIELNHEDGLLRVDVDAYDKQMHPLDIVGGLGRLPEQFIDSVSPQSPFAAVQVDRSSMPELMTRLAKLTDKSKVRLGVQLVRSAFEDVVGTVLARWNGDEISLSIPFASAESAHMAANVVERLVKDDKYDLRIFHNHDVMHVRTKLTTRLDDIDKDRKTPHRHTQTDNPSAIAFARLDIGLNRPVETYFELAPTHARLQMDFEEGKNNLAKVMEVVKSLVFRTL